jgi:hypothetical protein
LHGRFKLRRLAAEVTILGAATGLGGKDAFDLDSVSAPFETNFVGERCEGRDCRIRNIGKRSEFLEAQLAAFVQQSDTRRTDGRAGRFRRKPVANLGRNFWSE